MQEKLNTEQWSRQETVEIFSMRNDYMEYGTICENQ